MRVPITICWHCDRPLDGATDVDGGEEPPAEGAVSLCLYCGAIGIFDADMRLHAPTEELLDDLIKNDEFRKAYFNFAWSRQHSMLRIRLMGYESENRHPNPAHFTAWAWIGEDELGSGRIGLKQAFVPAGLVPLVSIDKHKLDRDDIRKQLQDQVNEYGKVIRLVQLAFVREETIITPEDDDEH